MKVVDIVGHKYGRLTVIERMPNINGRSVWKCLCECGSTKTVPYIQLYQKRTKSCGCLKREVSKRSIQKILPMGLKSGEAAKNKWFDNYRRDADKKGISFELTIEDFSLLTKGNCFYCNKAPYRFYGDKKRSNGLYLGNGIDRINSNSGYVTENVVTCCKICNYMKNTLDISSFIEHVNCISDFWRNK